MDARARPCRITGLTSDKGRQLNGLAASATCNPSASGNSRVPVYIEGVPDPLSLKRKNLEFLPERIFDAGIGVGRGTIREWKFGATAVDNMMGTKIDQQFIMGDCCRSLGNVVAARAHLSAARQRRMGGDDDRGIVIMCTDLNVARAINRVVVGRDVTLVDQTHDGFEEIKGLIRGEKSLGRFVFANFRPHRITPDGFDEEKRWGAARAHAVLTGAFKVYPCLCENYRDSMEVRFVDALSSTDELIVRHEIYLDYGPEEAELYVHNAVALDDMERLDPSVLAKVDPQAFWSGVLHIEKFTAAIDTLEDCDLSSKWKDVFKGIENSRELWSKEAESSGIKLPTSVVSAECATTFRESTAVWGITSAADHEKVASGCANVALLMMMEAAARACKKYDVQDGKRIKSARIEMLDYYRGYEIDKLASALSLACQLEQEHVARGEPLQEDHRDQYLKEGLDQAGFGMSICDLTCCSHCGKRPANEGDLKLCGKCNGAAYCARECQVSAWKMHKRECDPLVAHTRRVVSKLANDHGIKVKLYKPTATLPTQPCVFSETSGTGAVGIMWNPGQMSFISFNDTNAMLSGAPPTAPSMDDVVTFTSLRDLDPPLRFLLACGPLPDIEVARRCVDEVISTSGGDLASVRMKMASFTPLEWAAKKGNAEIVKWLCTDERTKCLVNEGCPVGWACYTGQVDIARTLVQHGADAAKTDRVLFYCAPPLLVAAENGQLEAMKFLVEELGQDIHMVGPTGRDVLKSIQCPPNWRELEGHRKSYEWARGKIG